MGNIKIIKPFPGFQERFIRSNVDVVVGGGALNVGKMQPLFSKILTPNGWITMGDVKIGTELYAPFGGKSFVTQIFPQGVKEVYELETLDGRKTLCGLEHLWNIVSNRQITKYNKDKINRWDTVKTEEIIKRLDEGKKIYLPIAEPQDCEDKPFKIDPYILGVILGDGCLTGNIKNSTCLKISNNEPDIIEKIAKKLNTHYKLHGNKSYTNIVYSDWINKEIVKLGINVYSHEKFIPKQYFFGSKNQRLELLKGLMDSDGSISERNSFSFSTSAPQLKDDFVHLCRSLGYNATLVVDKRTTYKSGSCWKITVRTNDIVFSSKKNLSRWKHNYEKYQKGNKRCRKNSFLRVKSVTKVGEYPCQCIMVTDKNNLYVTDDYLVTHNSFAALLSIAEYLKIPEFRAVFIRKNLAEVKVAGGLYDEAKKLYGNFSDSKGSDSPRITFPSGAWIDFTHANDERESQFLERVKGWQYDYVYLDEATSYQFSTIRLIMTRNRGSAGIGSKIRMTTNPHNKHWIRSMVDWYIGDDGFIRDDRDGCVRYFYLTGNTVESIVWGNSKEEVYLKCKEDIDRKLKAVNGGQLSFTYENLIKSFVFYKGKISDNLSVGKNKDYIGSIAASGSVSGQQLLEGNWNVDPMEAEGALIPSSVANGVFQNTPQVNGDKWITIDLAEKGTDNYVALVWNGFEIIDYTLMGNSSPRLNATRARQLQQKHDIADSHVIYDATGGGTYMNDYIQEAIPFISNSRPIGRESLNHSLLKDECYSRLIWMINNDRISFKKGIGDETYTHVNISHPISIRAEFMEECAVLRWKEQTNGKKRLANKKEMNAMLGRGRSMDWLDPMAMRMYPILGCEKGEEIHYGLPDKGIEGIEDFYEGGRNRKFDIYNDDDWA